MTICKLFGIERRYHLCLVASMVSEWDKTESVIFENLMGSEILHTVTWTDDIV